MSETRENTRGAGVAGWHTWNKKSWVIAIVLVVPALADAQEVPKWVSPARMLSGDGRATLQWSIDGSGSAPVFRIREKSRVEQQVVFTDQAEFRLLRQPPGDYCYWVQTCIYQSDGYPSCSRPSAPLLLTVMPKGTSDWPSAESAGTSFMACEPAVMRSLRPAGTANQDGLDEWTSTQAWRWGERS